MNFWKVSGQGDPVVFIHGAGMHGDGWLPQTVALSSRFRCLTFDNRGNGKSPLDGVHFTIEQLGADTLEVMNAAGLGAAHIVGHSMGGAIAQQVALMAPKRVRTLSLLCTTARGSDAAHLSGKMIWLGLRSRVGTRRMRRHAFLEMMMPPGYLATQDRDALAERLAPLFGRDLADRAPMGAHEITAMDLFDASARLTELAGIPTLVLSAKLDLIVPPACSRALAAGIPGAKYVEIPGAAHLVPVQCPEVVNEALLGHFAHALLGA